ncbi:mannose-binding protein [Streptomyces sp. NPDC051954]|uniref:mannose-binding protein n=1 Tax=unclassified Streptomyces TaxID=2593676 RepID=UPI003416842E
MSPQHQTPGANAEAAAARAEEAGLPSQPSAPDEAPPDTAAAPEAEPGTTPAGETTAAAPPTEETAAAATAEAPEEGVAVAAAVGTTPPAAKTQTGFGSGRPRKPVLAGAAIAGAVLIAVPLLLAGSGNDDGPRDSAKGLTAGSDTVLNPNSAPAGLDDYVAEKPSASPKKEKPKKSEPPKVTAPVPAAPASEPSRSSSPKAKTTPKPKPKPSPKPNWSTETVLAPSVLEVNQAWTTNRIRMVMQTDGNLVVYNELGKAIWASMTFGQNHRAIFQQDGNLVIHNADDRPIWASQSHGHDGAQLVLQGDAKVVIVYNGSVIWST